MLFALEASGSNCSSYDRNFRTLSRAVPPVTVHGTSVPGGRGMGRLSKPGSALYTRFATRGSTPPAQTGEIRSFLAAFFHLLYTAMLAACEATVHRRRRPPVVFRSAVPPQRQQQYSTSNKQQVAKPKRKKNRITARFRKLSRRAHESRRRKRDGR